MNNTINIERIIELLELYGQNAGSAPQDRADALRIARELAELAATPEGENDDE